MQEKQVDLHLTLNFHLIIIKGRSISLVGENERHLLKDILKTCKVPAKMRIIPQGKSFEAK